MESMVRFYTSFRRWKDSYLTIDFTLMVFRLGWKEVILTLLKVDRIRLLNKHFERLFAYRLKMFLDLVDPDLSDR